MTRQRALALLTAALLGLTLSGCGQTFPAEDDGRLSIVATVFPAYDFARAAAGELGGVSLLLPPGAESHSYEPTPRDILAVGNCDLFLYLGGESDAWVETILESLDHPVRTLKMLECVEPLEEETLDGMTSREGPEGHEGEVVEYDEHVWTDPANAAAITAAIGDELAEIDGANASVYQANAENYVDEIDALDREFRDFWAAAPTRTLIFGDRFPLRYFAEAYDLDCYAAFPGCSTQTEPSAATIAFLTDRVREEELSTVFYIEFSNHRVADSIAESAGAETALFHSCHNVSRAELDAGATYLTLMEGNLAALRTALTPVEK